MTPVKGQEMDKRGCCVDQVERFQVYVVRLRFWLD